MTNDQLARQAIVARARSQAVYRQQVARFLAQARKAAPGSENRQMWVKLARIMNRTLRDARRVTNGMHERLRAREST